MTRRLPIAAFAASMTETLPEPEPSAAPIPRFRFLEIETRSTCNRRCAACIRNSHPSREAIQSWFEPNELPLDVIDRVMAEARALGCATVVLSHYNEPLEDLRLGSIATMARSHGFSCVWAATNMDLMTPERARELDGKFDDLFVALYPTAGFPYRRPGPLLEGPEEAEERAAWLRSLFHETRLDMRAREADGGMHIPSHFSPIHPVDELAKKYSGYPCHEPTNRMIVNHRGDMLLCCQDVVGHFALGSVHDTSVNALWYSARHQALVRALSKPGGRSVHTHCTTCPQLVAGGEKY